MTKLIRRTHMYLALALGPWMAAYALSTMVMGLRLSGSPSYEVERTIRYEAVFADDAGPRERAEQILASLDLEGAFRVHGLAADGRLTITREHLLRPRRIVYAPAERLITVERAVIHPRNILNRFHHLHTYEEPYAANRAMAVSIDIVGIAMILWVLSGLWMWWEMKATRPWGLVAGFAGMATFLFFAWFV
jgi:hypothetical protein